MQTSEDVIPFSSTGITKFSVEMRKVDAYGPMLRRRHAAGAHGRGRRSCTFRWSNFSKMDRRESTTTKSCCRKGLQSSGKRAVGYARRPQRSMKTWSLAEPTGPNYQMINRPSYECYWSDASRPSRLESWTRRNSY